MKILGLDFETTGLDASSERVIEIGAIVWDTESKAPLSIYSELVLPNPFAGLSADITKITGITDAMLNEFGVDGNEAFEKLQSLVEKCDYIVAHNADFDRAFYEKEIGNYGIVDEAKKPWIDTLMDVPYDSAITTRKLTYLAAEHGIVNSFAHRAIFDVLAMLKVLTHYDFNEVIKRSESPGIEVVSHVSFEEKDKAKDLGFRWDGKRKKWLKNMKECDIQGVDFPFEITVSTLS